jgi:hypothetical protein
VLLASGTAIPIADLKPGDKVLTTNVKTHIDKHTVAAFLQVFDQQCTERDKVILTEILDDMREWLAVTNILESEEDLASRY